MADAPLTQDADWWRAHASKIEDRVAASGSSEAAACFTDMRTLMQEVARQPAAPQPPAEPLTPERDVEARVCAEIMKRQAVGLRKYGQRLCDNPADILARLQHLLEEQLDAAIYTRWAMDQLEATTHKDAP